ncbi:MAG: alpha/beta hydrolase [Bacteroides sp.]|nr:alpha/beta hydrolase [Bacteroides sp.]
MTKLSIAGVDLNFTDSGEKELRPVVIMHGWGCNISTVASIANIFKDRMRVINIDLPGHGESSEPPSVWGVEDFVFMLEEFVATLGLNKPSLIGHSFGGRVAIQFASRNDTERIMLVDAAGIKPKRSLKWHIKVRYFKTAKKLLPLILGKEKGERIVETMRRKKGSADYAAASPMMRAVMSKCVNQDLKRFMPDIKAPTLLVWGEKDTATPLSDARTMEKLIPDAGLVSFPGCGHYSFLDNPSGFRAVTESFFGPLMGRR